MSAAFRPDGRLLVTGSADGTVRQWDVTSGREVELPFVGHLGEVVAVAHSPDGRTIAPAGWDRMTRVWTASKQESSRCCEGTPGR